MNKKGAGGGGEGGGGEGGRGGGRGALAIGWFKVSMYNKE